MSFCYVYVYNNVRRNYLIRMDFTATTRTTYIHNPTQAHTHKHTSLHTQRQTNIYMWSYQILLISCPMCCLFSMSVVIQLKRIICIWSFCKQLQWSITTTSNAILYNANSNLYNIIFCTSMYSILRVDQTLSIYIYSILC